MDTNLVAIFQQMALNGKPSSSNLEIIIILSALAPTLASLAAWFKSHASDLRVKAADDRVRTLAITINGRMDQLLEARSKAGVIEGRRQIIDSSGNVTSSSTPGTMPECGLPLGTACPFHSVPKAADILTTQEGKMDQILRLLADLKDSPKT